MKKLLKSVTIAFFIIYIFSVGLISIFFVPKYSEYRDENTKLRDDTGYYFIFKNNIVVNSGDRTFAQIMGTESMSSNSNKNRDLIIDYLQWFGIIIVESVIFLLPFVVLQKKINS